MGSKVDFATAIGANMVTALDDVKYKGRSGFMRTISEVFDTLARMFDAPFGRLPISKTEFRDDAVRNLKTLFADNIGKYVFLDASSFLADVRTICEDRAYLGSRKIDIEQTDFYKELKLGIEAIEANAIKERQSEIDVECQSLGKKIEDVEERFQSVLVEHYDDPKTYKKSTDRLLNEMRLIEHEINNLGDAKELMANQAFDDLVTKHQRLTKILLNT